MDSNGAFSIDPSTGWLSISNSTALDRERTAQLILWVIAVEEQPNVQTTNQSSARIDIQLMDANDNSPVFIPNNLYSFSVEAGVETGTIIGQVFIIRLYYAFTKREKLFFSGSISRVIRLKPRTPIRTRTVECAIVSSIQPRMTVKGAKFRSASTLKRVTSL